MTAQPGSTSVRTRWRLLILGSAVALVLVCFPRFNQQDLLVRPWTGPVWDAYEYVAMIDYWRAGSSEVPLTAPFAYRPLVPCVAAALPVEPLLALNLINLAALQATVLLLYDLQRRLNLSIRHRVLGCALFIFSFPVFYYGAIGLVDPVLIFCLTAGVTSLQDRRYLLCGLVFLLGTLVKESVIILWPVAAVHVALNTRQPWRNVACLSALYLGGYLLLTLIARNTVPVDSPSYVWQPSWSRWAANILRLKTWLSFSLSFGVPGVLALYAASSWRQTWFRARIRQVLPLLVGVGAALAVFGYATVSAYADGRFIWLGYPFAIPLGMLALAHNGRPVSDGKRLPPPPPHILIAAGRQSRRRGRHTAAAARSSPYRS